MKFMSFDHGWEVRRVILSISKGFDKVWHQGLLLKLNHDGISRNLLKIIKDFLKIDIKELFQGKMSFDPDPSKQAQEVIFSCKIKKPNHSVLIFNNNQVIRNSILKKSIYVLR